MIADLIDRKKLLRIAYWGLYMILFLILQNIILSHITILGVRAFFLPCLCVAVGMTEDETPATVFGMIMGILCDICYSETTVMYTILFTLLGFFFSFFARKYLNSSFLPFMAASLAALLITGLIQAFSAMIFYSAPILKVLAIAGLQTLWSLPICALVYPCTKLIRNKIEANIRKKAGEHP